MWKGPYNGYLKLTPFDVSLGKSKTLNFKTLEEAQNAASSFEGRVGGITQINENKFTLRKGTIVLNSPKGEKSWIFCKNYKKQYDPEAKGPFKLPKGLSWKKPEIRDEDWFVQKKFKRMKDDKEWSEWKYEDRIFLLNSVTNEIRDINTKQKIGNRMVFLPHKKSTGESFEVFVWCVTPY